MEVEYPLSYEPATPEYVLKLFQADLAHRDPPMAAKLSLSFRTPLLEWAKADGDLFDNLGLSLPRNFKEYFGIELIIPPAAMSELCRLAWAEHNRMTVRDFCELLMPYIQMPTFKPIRILGRDCLETAIFLTLRSQLANHGENIDDLRPSTRLAKYARRNFEVFDRCLRAIMPNDVPKSRIFRSPAQIVNEVAVAFFTIGFTGFVVYSLLLPLFWRDIRLNEWMTYPHICIFAAMIVVFGSIAKLTERAKPAHVDFGEIFTFRDLAIRLADRQRYDQKVNPAVDTEI